MNRNFRLMAWAVLGIAVLLAGCDLNFLQTPVGKDTQEEPPLYALLYDGNGHTSGNPPATEYFLQGATVTVKGNAGNLSRTSYLFSGWNTASDGTGIYRAPGSTFLMGAQSVKLYAVWEPEGPTFQARFVALTDTGNAWVSYDGSTWEGPYSTGLAVGNDLAVGGGTFVAVGQIAGGSYGISWSEDGIVWQSVNLGGSSASLYRIAASPAGAFVTIGQYPGVSQTFISSDGKNWTGPITTVYTAVGPAWLTGSVYGNAFYITTGNGIGWYKSSDGSSWWSPLGGTGSNMYAVTTLIGLDDRIVVGGGAPSSTNKQTRASTDGGLTFASTVNVHTAPGYIYGFAANPATGRILSVGSLAPQVNYSDDYGSSWTQATGISGTATFQRVYYGGGRFLTGNDDGEIYSSLDGATFSASGTITGKVSGLGFKGSP